MSRLAQDPNRKIFVKKDNLEAWECWDYKTFYMNIRKQNQAHDIKLGRDENKYVLYMSSSETFDNIDTPELAMQKGYGRAKELYNLRLISKPFML